ncbi:MAG: hypothetical protein WDN27_04020 [Candidatus Saccharibacteria bacterium]
MDNKPTNENRPPRPPRQNGGGRGGRPQSGGRGRQNGGQDNQNGEKKPGVSRGAAVRAQKRTQMDAQRVANQFMPAQVDEKRRANFIDDSPRLKVIGLGGMDGGGSKNTMLVEYMNDAVIIDAGNDLSVDLPGINYGIADTAYLESIKHKLRAYVITMATSTTSGRCRTSYPSTRRRSTVPNSPSAG